MENAADALKMAAAILIFIIAIATSFSVFGTGKETADSIIGMRDKQAYLESAELDSGILYTSTSSIKGDETETDITKEYISGITKNGDRVVSVSDVISTIYRYAKEKYGVTIIDASSNQVIARFDSSTEAFVQTWTTLRKENILQKYEEQIKNNISNDYISKENIKLELEKLYEITNTTKGIGAPWYGNDVEIQKRINHDIAGTDYEYYGQIYQGKGILKKLEGKKIIEVTNEIDRSKYLEDDGQTTDLLQQYSMPTVEVIYIVL